VPSEAHTVRLVQRREEVGEGDAEGAGGAVGKRTSSQTRTRLPVVTAFDVRPDPLLKVFMGDHRIVRLLRIRRPFGRARSIRDHVG
jgi:hypothetical protein